MQQYQGLKLNLFKIRHCTMFRLTWPSSGALKFEGAAVPSALL
jgi:hypothetical protein